jgi:hypothetical protein
MKNLRITEPGWEGYSGPLYGVMFADGLSVEPATPMIASLIAGNIRVEDDEGKNPSDSQAILDSRDVSMDAEMPIENITGVVSAVTIPGVDGRPYTREELEAVAAEKGIEGLRDIVGEQDVKANSIVKLIENMLKAGIVNPATTVIVAASNETGAIKTDEGEITIFKSDAEKQAEKDEIAKQNKAIMDALEAEAKAGDQ